MPTMPESPKQVLFAPGETLQFAKELAASMRVSSWFIASVKRAGCPFVGRKSTRSTVEAWITANPDFKAKSVWGGKDAA